jgi:acyl-CoA synthetase (AMP-forming)/AMP-acid ligase II
MEGYWEDPEKTAEVKVDGWFATGDLGYLDDDSYLWFSGRQKHVIICDGDNVHPREIEHEIVQHPPRGPGVRPRGSASHSG